MGMAAAVALHIYDVSTDAAISDLNEILKPIGTGVFHGGVEVYGLEWSYGYTPDGTGVFQCLPKQCTSHTYRESIDMGATTLSKAEVSLVIEELMQRWLGTDYDLLRYNCVLFCDDFCCRLGVGHIPNWVTNLAGAGATIQDGILHAVSAGQAAAIIAAAKAGDIDARYNIQGKARAGAREFCASLDDLNENGGFRVQVAVGALAFQADKEVMQAKEVLEDCTQVSSQHVRAAAAGMVAQATAGAAQGIARAAGEIFREEPLGGGMDATIAFIHPAATDLSQDPFLQGEGLEKRMPPPAKRPSGGAAAAVSSLNVGLRQMFGVCSYRKCL